MKINPGKGMKSKKPPYHYTNKQTNGQQAITLKTFYYGCNFYFWNYLFRRRFNSLYRFIF